MTLRLYKGYAFSSDYSEVMDCRTTSGTGGKSPHAAYLETLESTALVLDSVYLTYSGTINLDWDALYFGEITQYNYMALINDDLTLYAFIRDRNYVNGIAVVTYDLDIWSSYSPKMTLRQSMRAATRFPVSGRPYALPAEYFTNTPPTFTPIIATTPKRVAAVAVYQYYRLSTDNAKQVARDSKVAMLSFQNEDGTQTFYDTYATWQRYATQLVAQSSVKTIDTPYGSKDLTYYYEISAVYLIPEDMAAFPLVGTIAKVALDSAGTIYARTIGFNTMTNTDAISVLKDYAIPIDPAVIGVGVRSNIIPLSFNGMARTLRVSYGASDSLFNLFFEIDGAIYNAEDNFRLELPYTPASAAETQQARIARQLEEANAAASYWRSAFQLAGSVGQTIGGIASAASGAAGNVAGVVAGTSAIVAGIGNIGAGIESFRQTTRQLEANGTARRLWAGGALCESTAQANSTLGIGLLTILPANTNEVKEAIAEGGYNIAITTSSLDIDDATVAIKAERKYDVVRYSFARISGQLPETIKDQLRAILVSGFKLWYTTPTT